MTARKKLQYCNNSDTILIPELEEAMLHYRPLQIWTDTEKATIRTYYGKVPISKLSKHLKRTVASIHNMAERLGLCKQKGASIR